jgi:hypothetical protein
MYYRLSCIRSSGEICGYIWITCSQDLFVSVATGTRPLGNADAQIRNSPTVDPTFDGSPVYYGHVWYNGWQTDLDTAQAVALYAVAGQPEPGT